MRAIRVADLSEAQRALFLQRLPQLDLPWLHLDLCSQISEAIVADDIRKT